MNMNELKASCLLADAEHMRGSIEPNTAPVCITSYDWREAFGCAGSDPTSVDRDVVRVLGERGVPRPFGRSDVAFVAAVAEGQNDGPNWVCVGKLLRGEWFVVAAGCDYTGWGCQQSGQATLSRDLDAIVRLGLGDDERERLMPVPAHEMFARAGAGEDE